MENTVSKPKLWTSYVMSGLVILFMLMDSIMKFVKPQEVIEGTLTLGFAEQIHPGCYSAYRIFRWSNSNAPAIE
jgi:hypothetical protein